MIKIDFNSETIETRCTLLSDVLAEKNMLHKNGIAVALNQQVISKQEWEATSIKQNDSILVITATQGG